MLTYKNLKVKVQLKIAEEKKGPGSLSARFIFEPLPVGFGHTLGSALRRVLLSSIPGAAVTQANIEGVTHPFSTIPGVREDVVDLMLNIKKIRLKIFNNQPVILKAAASGLGPLKDSDLEVVGDGEVVDQNLTLVTLTDKKAKISLELTAETGIGYEPAEDHPTNKIGVLPVDSIFSPVRSVSYSVGSARVGQVTSLDSLAVDLATDGTVTPTEALQKSCEILKNFFTLFAGTPESPESLGRKFDDKSTPAAEKSNLGAEETAVVLEDLGLSTRTTNALLRAKIKTLGDLAAKRESLSKVKGLGQKGLAEISQLFEKEGWK